MTAEFNAQAILLRREKKLYIEPDGESDQAEVQAFALELAELGYAPSHRLQSALRDLAPATLSALHTRVVSKLAQELGADQNHKPLFRKFPQDVPADTRQLWWKKVLNHYLQAEHQPCLFCAEVGTTHVLKPCEHVVCDRCFDGANYSACPVCEHKVDTDSPFFKEAPVRSWFQKKPKPRKLTLIDLGTDLPARTKALFVSFCERTQPMTKVDAGDLARLTDDLGASVLGWLPDEIPVRENVAQIFGVLLQQLPPAAVMAAAEPYLKSATDLLRIIAAYSGADVALLAQPNLKRLTQAELTDRRWAPSTQDALQKQKYADGEYRGFVVVRVKRFKVAPMSRPVRRALLTRLDTFDESSLTEDMLRHQSLWTWVGRFLHPGEFKKLKHVQRAFAVVRKTSPDGTKAPRYRSHASQVETALINQDHARLLQLLSPRPGIFARRFDHALRNAIDDPSAVKKLVETLQSNLPELPTPMVCTLLTHFRLRHEPQAARVFWPKGGATKAYSRPDKRASLPADVIAPIVSGLEAELLRRFAELSSYDQVVVDPRLKTVVVPFGARAASPSAVELPKGSRIALPDGKTLRLFLHWCQPDAPQTNTDLDLSVAFYDANWRYKGVCSYYELQCTVAGHNIATSAGDLRNAPFPEGASEFVDVRKALALEADARFAVAVVNSYAGLPFSKLERAFSGLMVRDDVSGAHFDPQSVEMKFDLQGDNGVFLPFVVDFKQGRLTWLDLYSKGMFAFNNAETASTFIQQNCPRLIEYFESGARMSMYELSLLHAAARSSTVLVHNHGTVERGANETPQQFLVRLRAADRAPGPAAVVTEGTTLAALYTDDLELPDGSDCYALFNLLAQSNMNAADFLTA